MDWDKQAVHFGCTLAVKKKKSRDNIFQATQRPNFKPLKGRGKLSSLVLLLHSLLIPAECCFIIDVLLKAGLADRSKQLHWEEVPLSRCWVRALGAIPARSAVPLKVPGQLYPVCFF